MVCPLRRRSAIAQLRGCGANVSRKYFNNFFNLEMSKFYSTPRPWWEPKSGTCGL